MEIVHWEQARNDLACGKTASLARHLRACRGFIHPMLADELAHTQFAVVDPRLRGGAAQKFQREWRFKNEEMLRTLIPYFRGRIPQELCDLLANMLEGKWRGWQLRCLPLVRKQRARPRVHDHVSEVRINLYFAKLRRGTTVGGKRRGRRSAIAKVLTRFGGSYATIDRVIAGPIGKRSHHGIGSGLYLDDD